MTEVFMHVLESIVFVLRSVFSSTFALVSVGVFFITFFVLLHLAREARQARYKFLTVGSHKLRTPLSKIGVAVAEILEKKEGADARGEQLVVGKYEAKMLRQIAIEQQRLVGLVNLLLEVAESEAGNVRYKKQEFDLIALIQEVLEAYQTSQWRNDRIFIDFQSAEKHLPIIADKKRIGSVIQVLLENAITYSPGGGKVLVLVVCQRRKVKVVLQDPGMGILKSEKRSIFKKFYRSDRALKIDTEGTGVGLFLAKHIAEGHGGEMGFQSAGKNDGSTFYFTIPL